MALQSGESPRRVRAQIEKRGLMDVLQNQIVERKVLERVQAEAKFKDMPFEPGKVQVEAISMAAGGDAEAIPAAMEAEEPKQEKG
jgi:trigger factor